MPLPTMFFLKKGVKIPNLEIIQEHILRKAYAFFMGRDIYAALTMVVQFNDLVVSNTPEFIRFNFKIHINLI